MVRGGGSGLRRLTDDDGIESAPVWSPDGTRVALRNWRDGKDAVEVVDASGGTRIVLEESAQGDPSCFDRQALAWSPDGRALLFSAAIACNGPATLLAAPADGSTSAVALLPDDLSARFASFAPDGRRVAFVGGEPFGTPGLYVADVPSTGVLAGGLAARRIGPDLEPNVLAPIGTPRWAPDGRALAVTVGSRGIAIVPADGSQHRFLAGDGAMSPVWSPDGRRLAFQRPVAASERYQDRPCTVRTFVIDADGSNERRLDPIGDGCEFAAHWSPDGTGLLVLLITDDVFHLGFLDVDGTEAPVRLPDGAGADWQPVAAPLEPAP